MLQESRLAAAGIGVARETPRARQIQNLLYALWFVPIVFAVKLATAIVKLTRFGRALRVIHRLFGLRDRVLYLEAFFPENAGFHYRTQKWIEILNANGFDARVRYVFDKVTYERLINEHRGTEFQSIYLLRRLWHCLIGLGFNCVIVRRELLLFNDYGDLFLDKFLTAAHPNVVLDFDDDLSAAKREPREITSFGRLMFESSAKFAGSLRLYPRFIAGSSYLKERLLVAKSNIVDKNVLIVPTCVDYDKHTAKVYDQHSEYINLGWIGSAANHYLLDIVMPVLNRVARQHKIRFVVITSEGYEAKADFEVVHVPWDLEREIDHLQMIDIGLMPLYDNAEEKGKCGFKLIQYMGLGIVSIASAVTINNEIVEDRQDGFLVHRESDWQDVIEEVLARRAEFPKIGEAARRKIQNHFSFEANRQRYLDFVSDAVN